MMRRQDRAAAKGDDIELLDVATRPSPEGELETVAGSRGNGLAIAAAIAVGALGVAALATSGTEQAAPPTTPPTTTAPPPPSPAVNDDRSDAPAATIGEGPSLTWSLIDSEVDATGFEWVDGSFIGTGGTVDVVINPVVGTEADVFFIEPDELVDRTVRSSSGATARTDDPTLLLFPATNADGSSETVTVPPAAASASDLVAEATTTAAERLDDQVLVLRSTMTFLEIDVFRTRVGTLMDPIFAVSLQGSVLTISGTGSDELISLDDLDLTADEVAALQNLGEPIQTLSVGPLGGVTQPVPSPMNRIDWIAVIDDEFVVGGDQLWRSSNGVDWEQASEDTPRFGGLNPPGPDGVLNGLAFEADSAFLTLSTDSGRSWERVARPFENTWNIDSAFPIVAMTGWQDEAFVPQTPGWTVLGPRFELRIDGEDDTFELLERDGETILSGIAGDPASGFRFVPGSTDVWFVDPVTGEEIARFPQSMFASAFAAVRTLDGQPQLVAFANLLNERDGTLEWSLTRVTELFGPDALAVDIVPGDGWFLADVTTTTGRDLYLAEMPVTALRLASERRHPTHADITRFDD